MSRGRIRPLTVGTTRLTCATTQPVLLLPPGDCACVQNKTEEQRGVGGGSQESQELLPCLQGILEAAWVGRGRVEEKRCVMGESHLQALSA